MEGSEVREVNREGFVRRVLKRLNPFSGSMPDASDEFQEGIDRSSVSRPDQSPVHQGPTTLTPEPQR